MMRFFDWFQLAVLVCLMCLGFGTALIFRDRGIRVLVVDLSASATQALGELFFLTCVVLWVYETLAYALPLSFHFIPTSLSPVMVEDLEFKVLGMVLSILGLVIYGLALWAMGESWRIGIDKESLGQLVTEGLFAWTRNPIYVALDLLALSAFLLLGRLVLLVLSLAIAAMFHYQILREESFLIDVYGDLYRDYCSRVGRYFRFLRF